MVESVDGLSARFEEALQNAEYDDLDRHEVADLLERLADEVRKGYTELPEHRGPWWNEVHGDSQEVDDADE